MIRINSGALPPWVAAATANAMCAFGLGRVPAWHVPRAPAPAGSFRQSILTSSSERYEDELWWWERQPGFNLHAPTWGWLRAAYVSSAWLAPERLRNIRLPVLLIGTERDRLVSPAAIREAAAAIPKAELLMFADSGHEILREADRVRLHALERIDAFFDAQAR
jgi:lysophospholipase